MAELATVQLTGLDHLILVDAKAPVSFFAYPGKKSYLVPEACQLHTLTSFTQDVLGSLELLSAAVGAEQAAPVLQAPKRPGRPRGKFTADKVCKAIGQLMPENAIVVDEAITSGLMLSMFTAGAPQHDLIALTGGSIGFGLPNAIGASIACPSRKVIALVGDGSAMYTIQALWTMAREKLDVISIIFNNRSYAVLNVELQRVGVSGVGDQARAQLDLKNPPIDFMQMGQSMGVASRRATTTEEFLAAFEHALHNPGPHLIEAIVPPTLTGLKLRVLPYLLQSLANLPQPIARALKRTIAP
jgi:acetolactate synthase-1/2/3 large subunit